MNIKESILLPNEFGYETLKLDKIHFLKAEGSYTLIQTKTKKYLVSRNLKQFELVLPTNIFIRVHNSYIINLNYIQSISKGKKLSLKLEENTNIPIADSQKANFFEKLKENTLFF